MTDLLAVIHHAIDSEIQTPQWTSHEEDQENIADAARAVLAALVDPAHRVAVIDGLLCHRVLESAGVWDAPDVTDDQIVELEKEVDAARDRFRAEAKAAEEADPPIPEPQRHDPEARTHLERVTARENRLCGATAEEWDAYEDALAAVDERKELRDRVTVFYEDEDRPDDAVLLLRVAQ
jgi:hypothetical protein